MIRKFNIILLTLLVIIGVSCSEDYLDTTPTDAISADDALSSPENMMLVLNGLHRMMYAQCQLPGGTAKRTGQSHFMPSFDAIGGNIIHSARANGWHRDDLQWIMHTDATSTTNKNLWYQRYHIITSANSIINAVADGDFIIDEELNNILGQAYAYRAWCYHQLVMTYSKGYLVGNPSADPGVPLLLTTGVPYDGGPRGTVQEVYDQLEIDIDQAIAYLEEAAPAQNKSHISLQAAYGIKARISLSRGDWADAATYAVLARDGYPLLDEAGWLSGFNSVNLSEVIWGAVVIDEETNYYASFFYYVSPTFNGSQNRGNPKIINMEVYNQIPDTDYRKNAWLPFAPNTNPSASNGQGGSYETDPNYDNEDDFVNAVDSIKDVYGITSRHNLHPYMTVKYLQQNPGTIDPDDVIYMRSSEMYLIEAEALAMLNDISGAQTALAVLGDARDSNFDETIYTTQDLIMDQIKFQRHVELWGEGFSYHDHIRWDDLLDQTNSGAASVLYGDGMYQDRPSINDDWIWKIPQQEIDANPYLSEADQN